MPSFTMRLRDVVEAGYDLGLGPADYDLFDAGYYPVLKKRIVDHFSFQEIGQETPEQFIFFLNRKMREIMPLYNQRYLSARMNFDPLMSTDYTDILQSTQAGQTTQTSNDTSHASSDTKSAARNVNSETPQVRLGGDNDYATSASDANSDTLATQDGATTTNTNADTTGTGTQSRHVVGRTGSPSQLIMEYRVALINVDLEVLHELEPLFMLVWNGGDSYSSNSFIGGYGYGNRVPWMAWWL